MNDEQRRAIRMAMSGQADEPVALQTGHQVEEAPEPHDHGPEPSGTSVSPQEVLEQLQKHDPLLLELMALRALFARR